MAELRDRTIRFDWAIKRLLRQKANFDVLEGFLTVFIGEKIEIVEILESEGNHLTESDKFNRVDIKARDSRGDIVIIEVQNTRESDFLERILYGTAKAITEHISQGDAYSQVKKVYSISVLYFDLGRGKDYLYHGQNRFIGVHTGDELQISEQKRDALKPRTPADIFPEYILIRVNEFDEVATTPLGEWMDYLKNGVIRPGTTAPGLNAALEKLKYYSMTNAERLAYDRHIDSMLYERDAMYTSHQQGFELGREQGFELGREQGFELGKEQGLQQGMKEGKEEGMKEGMKAGKEQGLQEGLKAGKEEGRKEGLQEGRQEATNERNRAIVRSLSEMGMTVAFIAQATGLTEQEVGALLS